MTRERRQFDQAVAPPPSDTSHNKTTNSATATKNAGSLTNEQRSTNETRKSSEQVSSSHPSRTSHISQSQSTPSNRTASRDQTNSKDESSSTNHTQSKDSRILSGQIDSKNQTTTDDTTGNFTTKNSSIVTPTSDLNSNHSQSLSNSSVTESMAILRDQTHSDGLHPVPNITSSTGGFQTQSETSPIESHQKTSAGAICGIVFGILLGIILLGLLSFLPRWYKSKYGYRRGIRRHIRNQSSTDSNRAVRDRTSFTAQFGAHDPFAGPPSTSIRKLDAFPRSDTVGSFNLGKTLSRSPNYLIPGRPDLKPSISPPMIEDPLPIMHRSLSSHSNGMPVSCMSAVVKRMSSTIRSPSSRTNFPTKRESWTRDPYHRRGSILSIRNPDIHEDQITDQDHEEQKKRFEIPKLHTSPSSDLHYQDLPVGSTLHSQEHIASRPGFQYLHPEVPNRLSPWAMHSLSNESSSYAQDSTPIDIDEGEAVFCNSDLMTSTQAAIDAHLSYLSKSSRYSQDSEVRERLEVESPTDPAVRSVTPNSLVFVSFGAGRHSRYSERSRMSFDTGEI
ncbi:uncharacterized protein MELLADRAFT_58772 [Melampsora larici-populina 98AG31]|uniref:Uncharacterized protein n=1 Tax=Melampsora larici-populina (strain 98AG31 / pathotype 3-4-7) TaxID=747676 RepID=F4R4T1_MELLP|nr:uncharacterized protein MELLADRAFT_58772 [Melampsora larici-populina 98AG31]EGG12864.1 hypothetical protein MELLADRAFT_58772 [Melampsora larici-populina 98AG31]